MNRLGWIRTEGGPYLFGNYGNDVFDSGFINIDTSGCNYSLDGTGKERPPIRPGFVGACVVQNVLEKDMPGSTVGTFGGVPATLGWLVVAAAGESRSSRECLRSWGGPLSWARSVFLGTRNAMLEETARAAAITVNPSSPPPSCFRSHSRSTLYSIEAALKRQKR